MSLRSLSDSTILSRTHRLVRCERALTLRVLAHLNEIEQRKLHFKLGYRSMFDFCTNRLGYSASSAGRRIQTARAIVRFPEIASMLEANEANLVTIARVSSLLTPDNKDEILGRIRSRTQQEVDAIVSEYQPREVVRDRVKEVCLPRRAAAAPAATESVTSPSLPLAQERGVAGSAATRVGETHRPGSAQAPTSYTHSGSEYKDSPEETTREPESGPERFERRVVLQFAVGREFMAKLERFRSLVWHRLPVNATMEQVFELLLDQALEREDPAARRARREQRESRKKKKVPTEPAWLERRVTAAPADNHAGSAKRTCAEAYGGGKGRARQVSARVRDEVFVRDKGQCTFVGASGHRCESTRALQVDHVVPVARGGGASPDNLRLLCAHHNRLEAERLLGKFTPVARAHTTQTSAGGP